MTNPFEQSVKNVEFRTSSLGNEVPERLNKLSIFGRQTLFIDVKSVRRSTKVGLIIVFQSGDITLCGTCYVPAHLV